MTNASLFNEILNHRFQLKFYDMHVTIYRGKFKGIQRDYTKKLIRQSECV